MVQETIAIAGAERKSGSIIAQKLVRLNQHRLLLLSENEDQLKDLPEWLQQKSASGPEQINCLNDGCWEADIIILAVPFEAEKEIAEKIKEVANQKIVISIANPLNQTYDGLVTAPGTSAAEELQKLLPDSKVIKSFNTTFAADFVTPVIDGKQADAFIAGDDEEALETVKELVSTAGFNPIVAGDLSVSRTLENMQLLLIQLGMKYNYNWLAGWKILHN